MTRLDQDTLIPNKTKLFIRREVVTYITHNKDYLCYMDKKGNYHSEHLFNREFVDIVQDDNFKEGDKVLIPATFVTSIDPKTRLVKIGKDTVIKLPTSFKLLETT